MPTTRTYSPLPPMIPAGDIFCANPRVLQEPDSCPHTYGVRVCSCAAFATEPCRPTACITHATNLSPSLTDNCSLVTYHCSLSNLVSTILHSSFLILNWSHTFSAKERDTETGLSYFGSRYYSSDLSIWLSVDPMSGKYPSLSPYVYCADNPVKLVDPNGCELWKPDEEGNLVAQQDDDYKSLAFMLNCSDRKAKRLLASQGYANGVKEGDIVMLDNQYTRSIKATCEQRLTDEQAATYEQQWEELGLSKEEKDKRFKELACPQDLYNCWSAAIAGSNGLIIGPSNYEIYNEEEFDRSLDNKYPVSTDRLKFGKTILRFAQNGKCTHAAVYYGTDNNGTVYIYSKNGRFTKPVVMPLNEFINRYGSDYGQVSGYYN